MEVELKLALQDEALDSLQNEVLPSIEGSIKYSDKDVFNEYFDTPDLFLRSRKIGFRVRTQNGHYEQTIKTQGQVQGGLHQRPEFNCSLDKPMADLTRFDRDIFAEDFDVEQVNEQLKPIFTTHFHRHTWVIELAQGSVELVYDQGEIKTEQDRTPINEIELELISGSPVLLFDLADKIAAVIPVRLSNISKAATGYRLLGNALGEIKKLPKFLPLNVDDSTEQGLSKAIVCALEHWQYHQSVYLATQDEKALTQIRESLLLLLQSVALYLPVLQSKELLSLHRKLLKLSQKWQWVEQLKIIHRLRSKKGAFSRRIPRETGLMNYLLGRREGLLQAYAPMAAIMHKDSIELQLQASRILLEKPWQQQNSGADIPVLKHANGWLSQTWQTVMQSLPDDEAMDANKYLALEVLLHQSLVNGFLLGDLFSDTRGTFRVPWLDLLHGISELKAIAFLRTALEEFEVDEAEDFKAWLTTKNEALIRVMEMSRHVAMQADTYW